jgi:hypothetical protein
MDDICDEVGKMSLRTLRKSIEEKCDIVQAILSFNYRYSLETREQLDGIRGQLPDATTKQLENLELVLQKNIEHFVERFGCRVEPAAFARNFIEACRIGKGIPLLSKAEIEKYFSNFSEGEDTWREFSPHLILQVQCDWIVNPQQIIYRYHLPEATLYEDMAFAFNSAFQIDPSTDSDGNTEADIELKRRNFHLRTAVLSAFYFVEAFLNGIAFDHCYRNPNALSPENRALLLEEPVPPKKQGFVSFEKKATQYLKIITGAQHPPLQETNCASLKYILNDGKELRDSIVHLSPKVHLTSGEPEKIRTMMSVTVGRVTETVDAAVSLVREINANIGADACPLNWLYSRTPEGNFPKEAFL